MAFSGRVAHCAASLTDGGRKGTEPCGIKYALRKYMHVKIGHQGG